MGRYTAVHEPSVLAGAGDARPTWAQVLADEGLVGGMADKVAVVTGTSSGLGPETAKAMAATGATVFATARDLAKARKALGEELMANPKVHVLELDLGSLASVRAFAAELRTKTDKVNVLVNNAGVMASPEMQTADGFELQFGTNHLGHFLLFLELRDLLLAGAAADGASFASRVVNVSSSGHQRGGIVFDDVNLRDAGRYDPWVAYGQSKTANIYMANEIERRYGSGAGFGPGKKQGGIHGYSLMPGGIVTDLQKHQRESLGVMLEQPEIKRILKSPAQGAATQVFAAVAAELEGKGGVYLEDCEVAKPMPEGAERGMSGYAPWAYDEDKAKKLWELSLQMVGWKE